MSKETYYVAHSRSAHAHGGRKHLRRFPKSLMVPNLVGASSPEIDFSEDVDIQTIIKQSRIFSKLHFTDVLLTVLTRN